MRLPRPPLGIAAPALGYLLLEVWHFSRDVSPALGLRLATVACLVTAVLYERGIALGLWMLYSLFLALTCCSLAFDVGRSAPQIAMGFAALAACALANAGYLFFFHRRPVAADRGQD